MKYLDGKREEKLHCRNLRSCGAIMARPEDGGSAHLIMFSDI